MVQYLAGHANYKVTMDVYAKVKYSRPEDVAKSMEGAFAQWDSQVEPFALVQPEDEIEEMETS